MQSHELWLKIATEDLKAAYGLLDLELYSAVTYHCQQSAEKALKAYLAFKKNPIIKSHDLPQLIEYCMKFDKTFETILDAADILNPLSTRFRYPSEFEVPDFEDAYEVIKLAESVLTFASKKITVK
ncbi:HEPN domain-containing protein [Candidatus Babeliales bacterium]|nr:HEPN domain-containing protein [Candidatus Babeliales bacterium]